jgi:hypothetical protein
MNQPHEMQLVRSRHIESKSTLLVGPGPRFLLHALIETNENYFVTRHGTTDCLIVRYARDSVRRVRCHQATSQQDNRQVDSHDFALAA